MSFSRNYAAVPQTPTAPGYAPIPINQRAVNAAVLPLTQAIAAAAETVVLNPAVSGAVQSFPLVLTIPSKSLVEGIPFELLVSGDILVGGATPTAVFKLYSGTSMTLANNQLLATTAAGATATTMPFYIKTMMIGSTNSGKITGIFKSLVGPVIGAESALAATIANVNFRIDPVVSFMLTVTPNNANAASVLTLYEFAINCP
jgi:hypothetical protein